MHSILRPKLCALLSILIYDKVSLAILPNLKDKYIVYVLLYFCILFLIEMCYQGWSSPSPCIV